jgi:enoyl-CoA hydratase
MIEITQREGVTILSMADGKANTMTIEFCETLTARLQAAADARAIVITGSGRIFSAGVNLLRLLEGGAPYIGKFLPALSAMFAAVFFYPKPVVAAINGHAIAGGCVLACAADRRLMASDGGHIGVTELLVGVPFPVVAMEIMRRALAPNYFEDSLFNGTTFGPQDAAVRGFVHEIAEPEMLLDRAVTAAGALAALPPAAFALTKRQTRQAAFARAASAGAVTDAEVEQIWTAPETLARIRNYVERTLRKS